jgi:GNAT superfamily N-acetyltransferase
MTVSEEARASLGAWFGPERPGPMIHQHGLRAGVGRVRVDRWPDPRAVIAELPGDNVALRGDPGATDLGGLAGLVEAPPDWVPALLALAPDTRIVSRVIAELPDAARVAEPGGVVLLGRSHGAALAALGPSIAWIHDTWGGAERLAAAGVARGAVVDGRVVAVAVPFYVSATYEDIGVVTEEEFRGRGLSTACAAALVADARARGRRPSWSTTPDNAASLAIAARLGFVHHRDDVLYAVEVPPAEW